LYLHDEDGTTPQAPDKDFMDRFRFPRELFEEICDKLEKYGLSQNAAHAVKGWKGHRGDVMLAACLDILAQGSTYRVYRSEAAAAPATVHQYIQAFLDAMLEEFPEYLSWPSLQELQRIQQVCLIALVLLFPPS
jgi:hypothetical protein